MSNIINELKFTLKLLKQEWEEDLQQYKQKNLSTSLTDRKKEGICWYPVQIKKNRTGYAERIIMEVERFDSGQSHSFQSGKSVSVFSNSGYGDPRDSRANGVVNYVKGNTMVITLSIDDLPEWIHDGKIGVDLLFDEASYREMEFALKSLLKAEKGRLSQLRDILLGDRPAGFKVLPAMTDANLNPSQNEAVKLCLEAEDVAVIHGPPGTGKTTTLVAAIENSLLTNRQVMVCCPSNAAVDLVVEKLMDKGITTLRIGHPARVDEKILSQTLDARLAQHDSYKELKKLRKATEEYKQLARKYKRNFGPEERAQRKRLLDEAASIRENADSLEDYIQYDIFQNTRVFASTLVGAANPALKGMGFPLLFIDEAGQGLEPACWIPICKAEKVIMAGDHCQLPPTLKSFEVAKAGLGVTLFEKVIQRQGKASKMLDLQYRMPELIMGFSGKKFYKGELKAAPNTISHFLGEEEPVLEFIDTAGSGFNDHLERDSMSTLNQEEAKFTLEILEALLKRTGIAKIKENRWNIGLISPYRAQVRKLRELVEEGSYPNVKAFMELTTIDTIDGFQGQERDIIIIGLVRSNAKGEIGFLSDTRRMNVALTRARRKLIVIGDSATISQNGFYRDFLDYIEENHAYKSIYEYRMPME